MGHMTTIAAMPICVKTFQKSSPEPADPIQERESMALLSCWDLGHALVGAGGIAPDAATKLNRSVIDGYWCGDLTPPYIVKRI